MIIFENNVVLFTKKNTKIWFMNLYFAYLHII